MISLNSAKSIPRCSEPLLRLVRLPLNGTPYSICLQTPPSCWFCSQLNPMIVPFTTGRSSYQLERSFVPFPPVSQHEPELSSRLSRRVNIPYRWGEPEIPCGARLQSLVEGQVPDPGNKVQALSVFAFRRISSQKAGLLTQTTGITLWLSPQQHHHLPEWRLVTRYAPGERRIARISAN
jgi:hypothetical protein